MIYKNVNLHKQTEIEQCDAYTLTQNKNCNMLNKSSTRSIVANKNLYLDLNKDKQSQHTSPNIFENKKTNYQLKKWKYRDLIGLIRFNYLSGHEWYNKVYAYNKNYLKSLPASDKSLISILKNYCNMWPKFKLLKLSPKLLKKDAIRNRIKKQLIYKKYKKKMKYDIKKNNRLKPIILWRHNKDGLLLKRRLKLYKLLSPKKVFVDKGSISHTNRKVVVTLFTYNIQKLHLIRMIKKLLNCLFLTKIPLKIIKSKVGDRKKVELVPVKIKKKGVKLDRKNYRFRTTEKFVIIYKEKKAKLIKVFLYNRRLTLDEYLNSTYKYNGWNIINPNDTRSMISTKNNFFPINFVEKVEKFSKNKYASKLYLSSYFINLINYTITKVNRVTFMLKKLLKFNRYLHKLVVNNILNDNEKLLLFMRVANKYNVYKYPKTRFILSKFKAKKIYLASLLRVAWLLYINDVKFKHPLLVSRLKYLVASLYGKEVEFNLVELKKMHLSSDIYTEIVALKLKNQKNKLYRVLKWSLRRVDIRNVKRQNERIKYFIKELYFPNKIRNRYVYDMFKQHNGDGLNTTLTHYFREAFRLKSKLRYIYRYIEFSRKKKWINGVKKYAKRRKIFKTYKVIRGYLIGHVLWNLKFGKIAGIRVEAKGRLTRRRTAQRSVFKMRYKGGLGNVDSSFRGMPAVMLRGFVRTNVQYSFAHSKNLIGAYGVKGWVGYKMLTDGHRPVLPRL